MINRRLAPSIHPLGITQFPEPSVFYSKNKIPLICTLLGDQEVFKLEFALNNPFNTDPYIRQIGNKLLKKGTVEKNALSIASIFDYYGAFWEVETFLDYSLLVVYGLKKHFTTLVDLCFEILDLNSYPQDEIDKLISIEKEKLKINWEKTDYIASQLFREILFKEDVYGKIIRPENCINLNLDQTRNYFEKNWKNKVDQVFLSGNLGDFHVQYLLQKLSFFSLPLKNDFLSKANLSQTTKHYLDKKEALQTSLRMGFELIPRNHPDYGKVYLANFVLGGYFGSRLQKNIREDKGYTYGIHSQIVHMKRGSYFFISSSVNKEKRNETLEEIGKEVEILKNTLISKEELESVVQFILGNFQGEVNSPFDIMEKIKIIYQNDLPKEYYQNFQRALMHCTPEDIQQAFANYFDLNKSVVQLVG